MDALKPINANSLSDDEKEKAIASLIFSTEKYMVSLRPDSVQMVKHR